MRSSKLVAVGLAISAMLLSVGAAADDTYAVKVSGNSLTVTPKGAWHINTKMPWKLTCGSNVIRSFQLTDNAATVSGGTGTCDLHGGVCNGATCAYVDEKVTF